MKPKFVTKLLFILILKLDLTDTTKERINRSAHRVLFGCKE